MVHSYTSEAEALDNGLASGHTFFFGYPLPLSQPFRQYGLPGGYIISTANDMARYAIAMSNGGRFGNVQVIKPETLRQMQTAVTATGGWYGLGWFVGEYRGMRMVNHGGANEFFKSELMLFPNQKLGVVLLINQMSLLQAYLGYPQLQYGIVDVLVGQKPESGLPTGWIGLGLLAAFLATLFFSSRSLLRLKYWRATIFALSPLRRLLNVAGHLIFPVIFIALMPVVVQAWMQRGFTWKYAFTLVPDMMLWMSIGVGADLVQFLYKAYFLFRNANSRVPASPATAGAMD
jgi:CubicO group peptidase (beta-lactamase class C family)